MLCRWACHVIHEWAIVSTRACLTLVLPLLIVVGTSSAWDSLHAASDTVLALWAVLLVCRRVLDSKFAEVVLCALH